jgi:hypothetical protein
MAVDRQAFADYEAATLRVRTESLLELRNLVAAELRVNPESREDLLRELERIRMEFREAGHADLEDVVLEVMDFVTGWCSPHMRV